MTGKRDFLTLEAISADELEGLFVRAAELKAARARGELTHTLAGKVVGTVFEKASTRTRVSFEVGMFELGGHAVYLSQQGTQIGRGEPIEDLARVLGGYTHGIVVRTFGQERAEALARWAPVPVINGLTDLVHPCQLIADLFTVYERTGGNVRAPRYAWIGDGNNMAHSWINAAGILGLDLVLACPRAYQPHADIVDRARERVRALGRGRITVVRDPREAMRDVDVVFDRRVGVDGPGGRVGHAPPRLRRLLRRRRAAGHGGEGCIRAALPAGPPRRGDHGGSDRRAPVGGVAAGGEPPARTEGAAGAVPGIVRDAPVVSCFSCLGC